MWYVTYVCEYPIYEPAEGGYYYAGTHNVDVRTFQTWRKARQFFNKVAKEFKEDWDTGEVDWRGRNRVQIDHRLHYAYYNTKYIGNGRGIYITRRPLKEKGWVPYE